ncbi:Breast cancer anti-estrogen resistance protein 3 [Holothuria leucospilota]|uniref:Breast cancer anti-estrogen resistance protein 3 n=1 Tax=Holothuria leucospilota TaxID=206669 RepID=A0A9Q1H198_HOLLE|nr:Breast cancer anti-estrogen resistance protein 3 [Holothuria leucospilota]
MANGGNRGQPPEGKFRDGSEQVEKIYGGIADENIATKRKLLNFPWKGNSSGSLSLQQTATLIRPCLISHGETINVQFEVGEKLTIMFMYKNKYAVYRKSDGAIAVLSNAEFQGTTPAMLDGSKYGALLNNVEVMLMYAVAKVDYCDAGGFRLKQNDAILILAHCKGTFIGINTRKKVGLFSSDLVQPITKGRLCIFKGMILKMTVVVDCYSKKLYEGLTYDITKSPEGLFSWFTEDGQRVPLHALAEAEHVRVRHSYENESYFGEGLTQLQNNKRKLPQLPNNDRLSDENISSLYEETWFHGNLPRTEAEKILKNNGDFLVRNMSSHPGIYVLSCKTVNGCEHFKLTLDQTSHYKTCGGQFKSIGNLIQFHQSNLAPISRDPATIIWRPVKSTDYVKEMADKHYQEIMSNTEAEDPFLGMSSPTEENLKTLARNKAKNYDKDNNSLSYICPYDKKSTGSLENAEFCPSVVISNPKPIYENDAIKELSLNDEQKTMADDGGKNIVQESETEPDMVIPPQNTSLIPLRFSFSGSSLAFQLVIPSAVK